MKRLQFNLSDPVLMTSALSGLCRVDLAIILFGLFWVFDTKYVPEMIDGCLPGSGL